VHVAHREDKGHAYKVIAGKSKYKRLLGRPRHGSIILKWVFADYTDGKS